MAGRSTKKKAGRATSGLVRIKDVPLLPPRGRDAHKGDFGTVLVIAGSREMLGAACLTTEAALRSGAGLVTLACPESIQLHAAATCPCATSIPLPESRTGMIDPDKALRLFERRGLFEPDESPSSIAAGPGIGQSDLSFAKDWVELLRGFDRGGRTPIVLDADGLNAIALARPPLDGFVDWPFSSNFVLTPHPGEMGRLVGETTASVQADREKTILSAVKKLNERSAVPIYATGEARSEMAGVMVLKGAGTLVCDGGRIYLNDTGNPGMARGGSGDVLTGVIAGLIAQGMSRFDAATLGTRLHGLAGDHCAEHLGETSMLPTDLLLELACVFNAHSRGRATPRRKRKATSSEARGK